MCGECECGHAGVSTTRRESAYDMIRVDSAVRIVLEKVAPLKIVERDSREAVGCVLAEPVMSTVRRFWSTSLCLCIH